MKNIFFIVLATLSFFSCHAQIMQANTMEEVLELVKEVDAKEVNSKTLVIFDVDMVLVQPGEPAFQMANMKRFSPICKKIMKEIPAEKQMLFLSLMTTKYDPVLISDYVRNSKAAQAKENSCDGTYSKYNRCFWCHS